MCGFVCAFCVKKRDMKRGRRKFGGRMDAKIGQEARKLSRLD